MAGKSFLTQVKGFTPVIDALAKEVGFVTAAVYGIVWRFCQMDDGICRASLATMARMMGLSKATVMRHLKILEAAGYLADTTPGRRNKPHVYRDTGKALILGLVEARTSERAPERDGGLQSRTSRFTEKRDGAESQLMKEHLREQNKVSLESPVGDSDNGSEEDERDHLVCDSDKIERRAYAKTERRGAIRDWLKQKAHAIHGERLSTRVLQDIADLIPLLEKLPEDGGLGEKALERFETYGGKSFTYLRAIIESLLQEHTQPGQEARASPPPKAERPTQFLNPFTKKWEDIHYDDDP